VGRENIHPTLMKKILLLVGLLALATPIFAQADNISGDGLRNAVILVIRHAEKTGNDMGLSPEGQARANAYADYFKNFKVEGRPLKLDRLYSAAISKHSERCGLTLVPLSQSLGLTVEGGYPIKKPETLVATIQQQPPGLHSLISWHHGSIPKLLTELGADPTTIFAKWNGWPDDVFDWVIQLRYGSDGRLIEAKRIDENLMPGDADHTAARNR
jgi:hypothetical protein